MERCELRDSSLSVIFNVEPLFERDAEEDGELATYRQAIDLFVLLLI